MSDYILTYTKTKFYPLDPIPEDIKIEDIAHVLSLMTRPVKRNLSQYFAIEEKLQNIIYERFGLGDLSEEETLQISDVDDTLLFFEFDTLMGIHISDTQPDKVMEHDFSQRDFTSVEKEFISIFNRLTQNKKNLFV